MQVHHELELGVIIGKVCTRATAENWRDYVAGYVLGLDMTARDLQVDAKRKGACAAHCAQPLTSQQENGCSWGAMRLLDIRQTRDPRGSIVARV